MFFPSITHIVFLFWSIRNVSCSVQTLVASEIRRSAGVTQNIAAHLPHMDDSCRTGVTADDGNDAAMDCASNLLEDEDEYDDEDEDSFIAEAGYEVNSPAIEPVVDSLGSDMGVKQTLYASHATEIMERLTEARAYMQNVVAKEEKYAKIRDVCENRDANCAYWAVDGECEKKPAYMHVNCAPVCQTCDMLDVALRCPMDPNARDAFYPGELQQMFERIESDPYYQEQYGVKVLSRPQVAPKDVDKEWNNLEYSVGGPWVVMFDHVVTDEEADRLIELGALEGYKRSADVGEERIDGTHTVDVNNGRTSTNAWCENVCFEDPVARTVMGRIANITGVPETNSEFLQLLRYTKTQFYQVHSDYIPYHLERPCGVRALTFYIYLSDVEEGGGTNFPKLDMTVTPKKGRAVLWPSVHNDQPNEMDARTDHQALPVTKGVKYGANAWIHQRSFQESYARGCS